MTNCSVEIDWSLLTVVVFIVLLLFRDKVSELRAAPSGLDSHISCSLNTNGPKKLSSESSDIFFDERMQICGIIHKLLHKELKCCFYEFKFSFNGIIVKTLLNKQSLQYLTNFYIEK